MNCVTMSIIAPDTNTSPSSTTPHKHTSPCSFPKPASICTSTNEVIASVKTSFVVMPQPISDSRYMVKKNRDGHISEAAMIAAD